MCGRYVLRNRGHSLIQHMPTGVRLERFNIAPSQDAPVARGWIRSGEIAMWDTIMARWGFLPKWMPNGKPQINARAETISEKPMFRKAFAESRCLVAADGFYEWQLVDGIKQPHFITAVQEFAFAGIMTRSADDQATFTIITTAANDFMEGLHRRMPVMLTEDQWEVWVEGGGVELLQPFAGEMQAWPVTRRMNNPRYNEPDCIEAIT